MCKKSRTDMYLDPGPDSLPARVRKTSTSGYFVLGRQSRLAVVMIGAQDGEPSSRLKASKRAKRPQRPDPVRAGFAGACPGALWLARAFVAAKQRRGQQGQQASKPASKELPLFDKCCAATVGQDKAKLARRSPSRALVAIMPCTLPASQRNPGDRQPDSNPPPIPAHPSPS